MPLIFNGTTITSVVYNGTTLSNLYFNGVLVFTTTTPPPYFPPFFPPFFPPSFSPPPPSTVVATYQYPEGTFWDDKTITYNTAPGDPDIGNPSDPGFWDPNPTIAITSNTVYV